jgi:hypothetical protein
MLLLLVFFALDNLMLNHVMKTASRSSSFGQQYTQYIPITGANGRVISVQFNWIRNYDGIVRLVGAIPPKR